MKSKKSIKINPEHKGDFKAFAKKHGKTVQQMASLVLKNTEDYSPHVVKMATFAHNFKGKKAQVGIDNRPQLNLQPAEQNYNWLETGNGPFPGIPGTVNPINAMPITAQGTDTGQTAKTIPLRLNPDGSYSFQRTEGTGIMQNNPYVTGVNALATGITGIANKISDNRLKNREQQQVMESLQQPYWENMEGQGLNNIPAYTKAGGYAGKYFVKRPTGGGPLTSEGAKEILRDGTINGKKITSKQKKYFGWVAGGKKGAGGDCDDCDHEMKAGGNWIQGAIKHPGRCKNPGSPDCPEGSPQYNLAMRFKSGEFRKKQVGGSSEQYRRLTPDEMQQWNQFLDYVKEQGYEGSPELNVKNKNLGSSLFSKFKQTNPNITIDYDIVPSVQNEMQILGQSAREFAARRNDPNAQNLMTGISPVDSWFGSKTSQFRFPSAVQVTKRNNQTVGTQNLGLVSGNIQATGTGAVSKPRVPKGVKIETFYDAQGNATGQGYEDPATGNLVELKYGGHGRRKYMYQAGGDVPPGYHMMPDGSLMSDDEMQPENGMPVMQGGPVEAEAGEIVEGGNGQIFKVSDNSNTHEQGGVKMGNVKRVLEDTSDQRKDRASKMLRIAPEEMEALFGFKPNSSVSHSRAYELAKKHYDGQRNKVNNKNEIIAKKPKIDKLTAKSAELNFKTLQDIPTDEDVYDALFMHQEAVKDINDIQDDGSMKKHGGKYNVRGRRASHHKAQAGTESDGFSRPARGRGNDYYFDEGTQRWYRNGTVPSQVAKQQVQQNQSATQATVQPQINHGGIQPYQGGRTSAGRTTPMGNVNAFGFTGGLDAYKQAWSPVIDLSQYSTVQDAQQATYNYILQNAPQEAAKIWQSQGLTQKGRDMMNSKSKSYDPAFAQVASQVFDTSGRLKPGTELTNEQLQALTPAYSDDMLGVRSLTPSQMETSVTEPAAPQTGQQLRQPLNTGVNINPNFIRQPSNRFKEPIYWDEVAAPLAGLVEGREAELYNPVQLNQLRYKLLDPTSALNANQADYEAAVSTLENIDTGTGAEAANLANLQAQKYSANAQVLSQYENQNVGIKNREIEYNTGVRDRQSVADAQTRGTYHRNVQLARENQRQQRLKSIEDISRVIQMKRRQNRSGNLILKLSPAFNQEGEYNNYQYAPVLPADLGINAEMPVVTSKGKTTTTKTTKIGNTTVRSTNSSR